MAEHLLVSLGNKQFEQKKCDKIIFLNDNRSNDLLNDLDNCPHAYVLACLMDRQIKAELAWAIPFKIKSHLGDFDVETLASLSQSEYQVLFRDLSLHRFNDMMAQIFHSGVQDIKLKYQSDVSQIWRGRPSSAKVVYEFLQFKGSGPKIATMAANILARDFKIPFSDHYSIDVSADVHVMRVMKRAGLVSRDASHDSVIYKAREMNPQFPGIIDLSCWEIGRKWCRPINPNCEECSIASECAKAF